MSSSDEYLILVQMLRTESPTETAPSASRLLLCSRVVSDSDTTYSEFVNLDTVLFRLRTESVGLSDAIALFFSLRLEDLCSTSYRTPGHVYLENKLIFLYEAKPHAPLSALITPLCEFCHTRRRYEHLVGL